MQQILWTIKGISSPCQDNESQGSKLEENLRYHSHLVVRPRGRIPSQFQANVPELDTMNHIQLERNEISDSLALPANIDIPTQVRININDRILPMK